MPLDQLMTPVTPGGNTPRRGLLDQLAPPPPKVTAAPQVGKPEAEERVEHGLSVTQPVTESDDDAIAAAIASQGLDEAPATRRFLENPENAARVETNDLDHLGAVERIGRGFQRGMLVHELGETQYEWRANETPESKATVQDVQRRLQALGEDDEGAISWFSTAAEIFGQQVASVVDPDTIAKAAGGAALGALVGPVGAVGGGAVGLAIGLVSNAFEQLAAESYADQREAGVDANTAYYTSFAAGAVNSAMEVVGLTLVGKPIAQGAKAIWSGAVREAVKNPRVLNIAKKLVSNYGAPVLGEAATESAQELVTILTTEISKDLSADDLENITIEDATNRVTEAFVKTFKGMVVLGLAGPGTQAVGAIAQKSRAKKVKQLHEKMAEAAKESNLNDDTFAEHISEVMDETPDDIYVEPGAFKAWLETVDDPDGFLDAHGLRDQLEEADSLGNDIQLPGKAYGFILRSENPDIIKDFIKLNPEDMSVAESNELAESKIEEEIADLDVGEFTFQDFSDDTVFAAVDHNNEASETIFIMYDDERQVGTQGVPGRQIVSSFVSSSFRGKGLGMRMYEEFIQATFDKGLRLFSDTNVSKDAQRVYDSLRRRGYEIVENPNTSVIDDKGTLAVTPESETPWVFEIKAKREDFEVDVEEASQLNQATEDLGLMSLFTSADEAGMTRTQYEAYLQKVQNASDRAAINKRDRALASEQRLVSEEIQLKREEVTEQVREEVDNETFYSAMNSLQQIRLDKKSLAPIAKELGFKLPDLYRQDNGDRVYDSDGISVEAFAELHGYENVEQLVWEMGTKRPKKEEIVVRTEQEIRDLFPELFDRKQEILDARAALLNDDQINVVETEVNALRAEQKDRRVEGKVLRNAAKVKALGVRLSDLNKNRFMSNAARFGKRAGVALRDNNRALASRFKFQQLLNLHTALQVDKLKVNVEKNLAYLRKFSNPKQEFRGLPVEALDDIREFLSGYDLAKKKGTPRRRKGESELDFQRRANMPDPVTRLSPGARPVTELTLGELAQLTRVVKEMEHKHRSALRRQKGIDKENLDRFVDKLNNQLADVLDSQPVGEAQLRSKWFGKARKAFREYASLFINMDSWTRVMDNGKSLGLAFQTFKQPVDLAMQQGYLPGQIGYLRRIENDIKTLNDVFQKFFSNKDLRRLTQFRDIPGLKDKITGHQYYSTLLHMGNKEGREALLNNYSPEEIKAIKDHANKKDWEFAQAVWDYLDGYWGEIADAEVRRKNVRPVKVEAVEIDTSFGKFRGGYMPLLYDRESGGAIDPGDFDELAEQVIFGEHVASHTPDGHTKARKRNVSRPLDLNINLLFNHVQRVVYDLEVGDAVKDVYKVLYHPKFKKNMERSGYRHRWEMMDLWFRDVINGEIGPTTVLEKGLRHLRTGFVLSKIGLNIGTIVVQPLGLLSTMVRIGKRNTMKGMLKFLRNPVKAGTVANELSAFMTTRDAAWDASVMDISRRLKTNLNAGPITLGHIQDLAIYPLKKVQRMVDVITWLGAMEQGMKLFDGDQSKAIEHADAMVKGSQASGQFTDRSSIERGSTQKRFRQSEWVKAITPLMSYFIMKNNLAWEKTKQTNFRNPASAVKWASDMALLYTVEAMIVSYLRQELPDDEDDDDMGWPLFLVAQTVSSVAAGLPGIRELASEAAGFRGGGVISWVTDTFGKMWEQSSQGEFDEALIKSANNLGGILLKYPASMLNKVGGLYIKNEEGGEIAFREYLMGPKFED